LRTFKPKQQAINKRLATHGLKGDEPMLRTNNLTLSYGEQPIVQDLNIDIPTGKITVLIGSYGCGKSTLLRSMARLLKPQSGTVLLDGKEIHRTSTKQVARKLAILPQGPEAPAELTVLQLVKMGRTPHQSWLNQWSEEDEKRVWEALSITGLEELADRSVDSLSGGQRQRAWIAMTLAQHTEVVLLDEPTTYLDLSHQIEILDILYELNEYQQRTIVMVLHDLNLACRYADHIIAVNNRTVYAAGPPQQVMNEKLVKNVFQMECIISHDPLYGTPMCIPYGKGKQHKLAI
jgi:iron complex transport system ATP-binding protein